MTGTASVVRRALKHGLPLLLLRGALRRRTARHERTAATILLGGYWAVIYSRYRSHGRRETAREFDLMATATPEAYYRHYNERVPTIEEEFTIWGQYHQHRHEMRYELVAAAARRRLPVGGVLLDIGSGAGQVADRLLDLPAHYIGLDYGGRHIAYATAKYRDQHHTLGVQFLRGDAEHLPVADHSVDVVVFTEVIEHLMRPELAVWEISRVLKPGGALVLTTNNASQMPLVPPTTNPFAWLEKSLGAHHAELISHRPWVWPHPVDPDVLPPGSPPIYLPHTWHIQAQTRDLLRAAGLAVTRFSTFEFPPPESASARLLERRGALGRRLVDGIEAGLHRAPLVGRLGAHLLLVADKVGPPAAPAPPAGVWPGPFSAADV
jgi:SAM-dependent methyltransferase